MTRAAKPWGPAVAAALGDPGGSPVHVWPSAAAMAEAIVAACERTGEEPLTFFDGGPAMRARLCVLDAARTVYPNLTWSALQRPCGLSHQLAPQVTLREAKKKRGWWAGVGAEASRAAEVALRAGLDSAAPATRVRALPVDSLCLKVERLLDGQPRTVADIAAALGVEYKPVQRALHALKSRNLAVAAGKDPSGKRMLLWVRAGAEAEASAAAAPAAALSEPTVVELADAVSIPGGEVAIVKESPACVWHSKPAIETGPGGMEPVFVGVDLGGAPAITVEVPAHDVRQDAPVIGHADEGVSVEAPAAIEEDLALAICGFLCGGVSTAQGVSKACAISLDEARAALKRLRFEGLAFSRKQQAGTFEWRVSPAGRARAESAGTAKVNPLEVLKPHRRYSQCGRMEAADLPEAAALTFPSGRSGSRTVGKPKPRKEASAKPVLTHEEREAAIGFRAKGMGWAAVAGSVGRHVDTVRRTIDPQWVEPV